MVKPGPRGAHAGKQSFYGASRVSGLSKDPMTPGMNIKRGRFTADEFQRRAKRFSLSLEVVNDLANKDGADRGDHDLNPDWTDPADSEGNLRAAGVLVGIVDREPGATVILTLRAPHLSSHAGQIAFPGGRADEGDASLIETALRETHEEIGVAPESVMPIGLLDPYKTRTGYRIVPVLGLISEDVVLMADEQEVAEVFEVPLAFLMSAGNHQRHSRFWQGRERHFYAMPYGKHYIWGATAGILRIMYERLYAE